MSHRAIGIGLFVGLALLFCLLMWGRAQVPLQGRPQAFPAPADPSSLRMQVVGHTMVIQCPSGKVTMRPAMASGVTVVEIDLGAPVPATVGK